MLRGINYDPEIIVVPQITAEEIELVWEWPMHDEMYYETWMRAADKMYDLATKNSGLSVMAGDYMLLRAIARRNAELCPDRPSDFEESMGIVGWMFITIGLLLFIIAVYLGTSS